MSRPDTATGAVALLTELMEQAFTVTQVVPDPQVEGVWLVRTEELGSFIVYTEDEDFEDVGE